MCNVHTISYLAGMSCFGGCNVHWGAAAEVLPSLEWCGNSREAGKHAQGHEWRVSRWSMLAGSLCATENRNEEDVPGVS